MTESLRVAENPAPGAWDEFVCARGGHLLQSAAWGELKARFGWQSLRVGLERGGTLVAGALILFRRLAPGLRLAYVPRGPIAEPADRETLAVLLPALARAAQARGAFALKVEPNWPASDQAVDWPVPMVPGSGFQPRTTIHIDLTRSLDAILAQMKSKWRYNIRLAERKGVVVRPGSRDDVPTFYRLLQTTSARDRFAIHSLDYYCAAFDLLRDHARLFIAEHAGEPLAAIFVTAFGNEAIYLYGASSNAHRERMPNHALHWAAIQWAREQGCARYDLWGIGEVVDSGQWSVVSGQKVGIGDWGLGIGNRKLEVGSWKLEVGDRQSEIGNRKSRTGDSSLPEGLYQFKQGFGGAVVRYADAYDMVFSRARFALYTRALAWRRGAG